MIQIPGLTRRGFIAATGAALAMTALGASSAGSAGRLRVGSLRFGSVNWLLDTIEAEGLAEREGVILERVDLASNQSTTIALQSRDVDLIVSDWLWAMRQRSEGERLLFSAYSRALGSLMVPSDSGIVSLGDLEGKKIGIAGSPLDKSWLLLRSYSQDVLHADLAELVEPVYGAPPLLSEQLKAGRLDGVLTFWNFAARLDAEGYVILVRIEDVMEELGIDPPPALVGFVWYEDLFREQKETVEAFFNAVDAANEILLESDEAWERLRPVMQLGAEREFEALREYFRAGIVRDRGATHLASNRRLFEIMSDVGGPELIGPNTRFDSDLFWPAQD